MLDEIQVLENDIAILEETLRAKKRQLQKLQQRKQSNDGTLTTTEIIRYSRQMIMPELTLNGQKSLKNSKILVVGVGGLGCPALLYLAAAGVGEIHLVDYDDVELTNLHRQVLHFEHDVGTPKVESAAAKLRQINSEILVKPRKYHGDSTLMDFVNEENFDVILDCTDNAPTRYLLNDICVLLKKPLVSGSALQMEGQLTVYNYKNGPCYRCLFPVPPPPETVTNCGDGGILGAVSGVIGTLQALETIKILTNSDGVLAGQLVLFNGSRGTFRNVKLRQKVSTCKICGDSPSILAPVDYEAFCGSKAHDKIVDIDVLNPDENISVTDLKSILNKDNLVLDVRPDLEFLMCKLPFTVNLPYTRILKNHYDDLNDLILKHPKVYVLCRRGNDSQRAVRILNEQYHNDGTKFVNVKGGLHAYGRQVDKSFPVY